MKEFFLFLLIFWLNSSSLFSQNRHALLIGINEYEAKPSTPTAYAINRNNGGAKWRNLEGCVNDIQAVTQIITLRYGFQKENIKTLFNAQATHQSIIEEIRKLKEKVKIGDVVFFYYSGHGSQVKNSLSYDGTGIDQTIVPSDFYDIRNKELAKIFNEIMDKIGDSGKLTLIFDSCHSGGIARGKSSNKEPKTRDLPVVEVDFKDASEYPKIEDRGALIFSAAQRDQPAKETNDEVGEAIGAFSYSFIQALRVAPINESAERLFMRMNILLKASNLYQDPILGGNILRKKQGIFGENTELLKGKTIIPIIQAKSKREIMLQGGIELALNVGTVLSKIQTKDSVFIKILAVNGIGKSLAEVVRGDLKNITAGDLFEVTQFAVPDKPNLKVMIPSSNFTENDLVTQTKDFVGLSEKGYFNIIRDPIIEIPDFIIQYHQNQWQVNQAKNPKWEILPNLSSEVLKNKISKGANVLLQLPAVKTLIQNIKLGNNSVNNAIEIINDPSKADYTLMGIMKDTLKYAWVKTDFIGTKGNGITPPKTDFFSQNNATADSLTEYALRLGRINAWINLESPPQEDFAFPYQLGLKNRDKGYVYTATQKVFDQERMTLVLKTDSVALRNWNQKKRFCYVFIIDMKGKTTLLYPHKNLGSELFPLRNAPFSLEEPLKVNFRISEPFGLDTYFLLTTETPIQDVSIFEVDGVLTRGDKKTDSPLSKILRNVGSRSRGTTLEAPMNWSFQKLMVMSEKRPQ
jgi:Caspase domain